jgi:hypothetical protein
MLKKIKDYKEKLSYFYNEYNAMPRISIDLKYGEACSSDDYYAKITKDFYDESTKRHNKLPLIKQFEYGVALFKYNDEKSYLQSIESSARRNYKKALRNGFSFCRIEFNDYLDDIWEIRKSAPVRQGEMPEDFVTERPKPRNDPQSKSTSHGYPYFGIKDENGKLVAYAGCLVAGQLLMVQHIYGHYEYQSYGVVPMLLISIAEEAPSSYPSIKYYNYGSYYGALASMQRFKKKFQFLPHKVKWQL